MVLVLLSSLYWHLQAHLQNLYCVLLENKVVVRLLLFYLFFFRYLLIKWKIRRYFKKDENEHYIEHCSLGDWLVLYQMSRNMNKRFFADFLSVLSKTVNPHPADECHEHHHFIKDPRLEKVNSPIAFFAFSWLPVNQDRVSKISYMAYILS